MGEFGRLGELLSSSVRVNSVFIYLWTTRCAHINIDSAVLQYVHAPASFPFSSRYWDHLPHPLWFWGQNPQNWPKISIAIRNTSWPHNLITIKGTAVNIQGRKICLTPNINLSENEELKMPNETDRYKIQDKYIKCYTTWRTGLYEREWRIHQTPIGHLDE